MSKIKLCRQQGNFSPRANAANYITSSALWLGGINTLARARERNRSVGSSKCPCTCGSGQSRQKTPRPFLSWTVKRKPMEQRDFSCLVKTRFVSVGGAKPGGLRRRLGIGQDAALGPRPRRRFKSRNARLPRRRFRGRAGRRKLAFTPANKCGGFFPALRIKDYKKSPMLLGVSGFGGSCSASFLNIGSNAGTSLIWRQPPDTLYPQSGARAATRN